MLYFISDHVVHPLIAAGVLFFCFFFSIAVIMFYQRTRVQSPELVTIVSQLSVTLGLTPSALCSHLHVLTHMHTYKILRTF